MMPDKAELNKNEHKQKDIKSVWKKPLKRGS